MAELKQIGQYPNVVPPEQTVSLRVVECLLIQP